MAKKEQLQTLFDMIADLKVAMFTTRREDGLMVSRPMATQARAAGADLWFVTEKSSEKLREIRNDRNVNLAYVNSRSKEWVSVAGVAKVVRDREKIRELYRSDWRGWFGDEGGAEDGTPDDPRMVLIGVNVKLAMYMKLNKPEPVVLFEMVKGIVTGKRPDLPEPVKVRK